MSDADGRLAVEIREGQPPVVVLTGEIDPHTAPQLDAALTALVEAGNTALRFDCSKLGFIDSSGLRVLVDAHRRLGAGPDTLLLSEVSPTLRRLLEVTGLDAHFTVEPASDD